MIPLLACVQDYQLQELAPVSVENDGGSAVYAEADPTGRERRERFVLGGGATTPVVDFLFVVDHSASMAGLVDQVRRAFGSLSGAFPAEARIAVMSTLPGDPADLTRVHPEVRHPRRNRHDPGFLRLVDGATIRDFLRVAPPDQGARFAAEGCGAWFGPRETNRAGVPCLVAHTQIAMDAVGVEAGLTAFGQLLERGDAPFRPGAAVNVVFVSDTQDPGLRPGQPGLDELVALRPDAEQLQALVEATATLASFRLHAVAPERACGERWGHLGPVYQDAAVATGGRTIDVCTATDYRPFVEAIVAEGAVVTRPVVALARPAADLVVEVDGERVGWSVGADGRALELDLPLDAAQHEVVVRYRVR